MNREIIRYVLSYVLKIEAALMLLPCIVSLLYGEKGYIAFLLTILVTLLCSIVLSHKKPTNTVFYAKEGFLSVSLSWILMSIFGALPFVISGAIPSFTDALFEVISGFTTTGSSILENVELLSHGMLFWRSFTHWIGGMGVLVFILTILPITGGHRMYLMKAESPGPSVEKLVPRVRSTALILYGIYTVMTVTLIILLCIAKMPVFDAVCTAFGTAGTGGFGVRADSIASYTPFAQNIVTVFMILFGVNFNIYYLILCGKLMQVLKSEELRAYLGIIFIAIIVIVFNVRPQFATLSETIRHSAFQVGTIITTTGFATVNFDLWPELSKTILVLLMFIGACAGSTGGGFKVSRLLILIKTIKKELFLFSHPHGVKKVKMDGKLIAHETVRSANIFLIAYIMIMAFSVLLISVDNFSFTTNFTAVAATLNNIGPGLDVVGPTGNFHAFSAFSKYVLMFDMLAGRLEIFPMLVLFAPSTWKRKRK